MNQRVAVLLDSSSDLTPEQAGRFGLALLPLRIKFAGRSRLDHLELTAQALFREMAAQTAAGLPQIVVPELDEYLGTVEALLEQHDEVLALHTSPRMGRVYALAFPAAQALGGRLTVVNSNTTSGGLALQGRRARRLLDEGYGVQQILPILHQVQRQQCTRSVVTRLDGFRRAGLIGPLRARLGDWQGVRPIVGEVEGKLEVLTQTRGEQEAGEWMSGEFRSQASVLGGGQAMFMYSSDSARLEPLRQLAAEAGVQEVLTVQFGAVLSSIVGPGAYGFCLEPR